MDLEASTHTTLLNQLSLRSPMTIRSLNLTEDFQSSSYSINLSVALGTDNQSFLLEVHYILAFYETTVSWFYLATFGVSFAGLSSSTWLFSTEVQKGTILDTLTISLHTLYLSDLIHFHGLKYCLHAVDSKIYILNPGFFPEF